MLTWGFTPTLPGTLRKVNWKRRDKNCEGSTLPSPDCHPGKPVCLQKL